MNFAFITFINSKVVHKPDVWPELEICSEANVSGDIEVMRDEGGSYEQRVNWRRLGSRSAKSIENVERNSG